MNDHTNDEGWMQLYSGVKFWPVTPDEESINIKDIAHALSNQCRFGGHTSEFYSVAQHCCLVSDLLPSHVDALAGLLHDATEAYLVDLPSPIKAQIKEYKTIELALERLIEKVFSVEHTPLVKQADSMALWIEGDRFLSPINPGWFASKHSKPELFELAMSMKHKLTKAWTPEEAKSEFMKRYESLRRAIVTAKIRF